MSWGCGRLGEATVTRDAASSLSKQGRPKIKEGARMTKHPTKSRSASGKVTDFVLWRRSSDYVDTGF